MIYTHCPRCRRRLVAGTACGCYDRRRDGGERLSVDGFYNTAEWRAARGRAIERTFGLDIFALYTRGEIVPGFTVHHITPLDEDYARRADPDNLIYLTEQDHRLIHKLYETSSERTRNALYALLKRFDTEYRSADRRAHRAAQGLTEPFGMAGGISKTFFGS